MFRLTVNDSFNATHALVLADGQREPMHGHDWQVRLTIAADALDDLDMVMDFHVLEQALRAVLAPLQHTSLNDHAEVGQRNPSAERVAAWIAEQLTPSLPEGVRIVEVAVTEAPGCIAVYGPG